MDKLQQVRDFLDKKVKEKGFSLNNLSLQLGKNSTYLFHFIKRNSPKRLDENTRRKLAKILDVDEQNLCDFLLPNNLIQDKLSSLTNFFNFSKSDTQDVIAIDVIDINGEHKGRFEQIKQNVIGKEIISKDLFIHHYSKSYENVKIFKAYGDSMSPTINADDFVWVDTSYSLPSSDGIYMISTNSDTIIRRLQTNPFDNSVEISSDNPSYKPILVKDIKSLNVCGKVFCITRKI